MRGWIVRWLWPVAKETWNGWSKHDGGLLSAATAYYGAFSLFPLCVVLIAAVGVAGRHSTFLQAQQQELVEAVGRNMGPWLQGQVDGILADVQARAAVSGPLGLLILLVAAIGIFMQLENTFDRIWGTPVLTPRTWLAEIRAALWDRLLAFLMLWGIGALLFALFLADAVLSGVRPLLVQLPTGRLGWHAVQWLASVGGSTLLLGALYKVLPKARVQWKHALRGGLLAAVAWAVGQRLLLAMVVGESYSAYGVLGVLIGLMLWFYYASATVFLGAEFARASAQCAANNQASPQLIKPVRQAPNPPDP
jgi:membrane protein